MTLVFDVNETLLDLSALDTHFRNKFGSAELRREWFFQVLQSAMVITMIDTFVDFGQVARAALEMVCVGNGIDLSPADADDVIRAVTSLPPYDDVKPALERLRAAGFRMAALSNSSAKALPAQLTNAGIIGYFEKVLSVDEVRQFKPMRRVYESAAEAMDISAGELWMIAAHDWDVAGAIHAGCRGAFVARPGKGYNPLYPQPDIAAGSLTEIAEKLTETAG